MKYKRNNSFVDRWSFVHMFSGGALTVLIGPVPAFVLTTLWEPFEILVLSPLLMRRGIVFGHETLRNSMSDLVFNTIGIILMLLILESMGWNADVLGVG